MRGYDTLPCMIVTSQFKPLVTASNSHMQTMWGRVFRRSDLPKADIEKFMLPDQDFVELHWFDNPGPVVVILHGLGGSIQSHYAAGIVETLHQHGFAIAFMHFRGTGAATNNLLSSYHLGKTDDLDNVVRAARNKYLGRELHVLGFSMGGSILLKWLGEQASLAPVASAVAVSVPFDPAVIADTLQSGFARIYQTYLLNSLKTQLLRKRHVMDFPYTIDEIKDIKNFWQWDNEITAKLHGFKDVHDYYKRCGCIQFLGEIEKPTLIIHAKDDPFMQPSVVPAEDQLSQSITLELADYGGHVGFVSGQNPATARYWLDERILSYFNS